MSPKTNLNIYIIKIKTPPFQDEGLELTNKMACTYFPLGQAPRFPCGRLIMSSLPKYTHYDWVDHVQSGALEI